jgi:hypothetical protein
MMNDQRSSSGKEDAVEPFGVPLAALAGADRVTTTGIPEPGKPHAPVERITPPPSAKPEDNGALAEFVHQSLRSYITFADQKAAFLFTAVSAVLAYIAGKGALQPLGINSLRVMCTWPVCIGLLAALDLVISAAFGIAVIAPRLTPGHSPIKGLMFWEDICSHESAINYAAAFEGLSRGQASEQVRMNCFVLAGICRKKYRALHYAIWFAAIGFALSVIFIALL